MVKNLSGKTAIVTGSSRYDEALCITNLPIVTETIRGIGTGIAIDLAKRGANVVVNYTSPRGAIAGEEVVKEIGDAGSKVALVQANVALLSGLRKLVEAALALSASGKIDILVHNAAAGDDCYIENMTEEFYESQTDVNLKGRESFGLF
jgi:3-oxoacyl-[acyl-carrier protein] reductase